MWWTWGSHNIKTSLLPVDLVECHFSMPNLGLSLVQLCHVSVYKYTHLYMHA